MLLPDVFTPHATKPKLILSNARRIDIKFSICRESNEKKNTIQFANRLENVIE